MKKRIEAISRTGKIKFLELEANGENLITRWGYVDGKVQETTEKCEEKNIGKSNYISAEMSALAEFERKLKKKMEEGYDTPENIKKKLEAGEEKPNLRSLQKYFTPCKPIAKKPKTPFDGTFVAERKFNGVNIIFVVDEDGEKQIYTRSIDDITENVEDLTVFDVILKRMKKGSMVLVELIYTTNHIEYPQALRAIINARSTKEKVHTRYDELIKKGALVAVPFDIMFWNGIFVGDQPFVKRRNVLSKYFINTPEVVNFTEKVADKGKNLGWEGFILRKNDSIIEYTMNGKASRKGSWKYKFEQTDDFFIVDAEYGKGKNADYFARFKLAQYDKNGKMIDCGYAGPGKMTQKQLRELYAERSDSDGDYKLKPYLVIEVEFRARQPDTAKLEFPIFSRIRDDKKPEESYEEG